MIYDEHRYLPLEDGGFIRKAVSAMSFNELKFLVLTEDCRRIASTEETKEKFQYLAKKLLF